MNALRDVTSTLSAKLKGKQYHNNLLGASLEELVRQATAKTLAFPDEDLNQQVADWSTAPTLRAARSPRARALDGGGRACRTLRTRRARLNGPARAPRRWFSPSTRRPAPCASPGCAPQPGRGLPPRRQRAPSSRRGFGCAAGALSAISRPASQDICAILKKRLGMDNPQKQMLAVLVVQKVGGRPCRNRALHRAAPGWRLQGVPLGCTPAVPTCTGGAAPRRPGGELPGRRPPDGP
jgi:hypothetical protein